MKKLMRPRKYRLLPIFKKLARRLQQFFFFFKLIEEEENMHLLFLLTADWL